MRFFPGTLVPRIASRNALVDHLVAVLGTIIAGVLVAPAMKVERT